MDEESVKLLQGKAAPKFEVKISKFVQVLEKTEKKLNSLPKLSQNYFKTMSLLGNV